MLLYDILNVLNISYNGDNITINKIRTDSRLIEEDDLFICVNSGYKYISDATKRGASCIITDKKVDANIPVFIVEDAVVALGTIAKYIRSLYKGKVIAITGSNGKTTTKEIVSHLLSLKYNILKTVGSENNEIGLPNTLLNLDNKYDFLIAELGTNHIGEIAYLTDIVKPDYALITNIGNAHIGNFKTRENIYIEKSSVALSNTITIVNGEDEYLNKSNFIKVYDNDYDYENNNVMNYKIAFRLCEELGFNKDEILDRIKTMESIKSRMHEIDVCGITIIDDAFNASYESVISGLKYISKYNKKVIIFGDMLELGEFSEELHKKVYEEVCKMNNYVFITYGEETKVINNELSFDTHEDIIEFIKTIKLESGDVIYIKGAHGMHLYELIDPIKNIIENNMNI